MPPSETDRNLLFGVLALQADLLDASRFAEACSAWSARKDLPLADLLIERGWINEQDRDDIDRLLQRKLEKHAGDVQASLSEVVGPGVSQILIDVDDDDVQESLSGLPPTLDHGSRILLSTVLHQPEQRERYTLTRLHARGGVGQVWLARDDSIGRDVALKELRPDRSANESVWSRFLAEAQITGQLEHPGIIPVYEVAKTNDEAEQPYYTMRFVRGRTLSEAIHTYHENRKRGEVELLEWLGLLNSFIAVCRALDYAHSRQVVHRDLKGSNVVLGDFGEVMVLDWGLAKLMDSGSLVTSQEPRKGDSTAPIQLSDDSRDETVAGALLGTPAYMAPEQAEGRQQDVDARTDVYGLGAILYQILTGQPPFDGEDTVALLRKVVVEPPKRPCEIVTSASPALESVCLKALAKLREERFQSAGELADEVQRFLADEPLQTFRERTPARVARWGRRHKTAVSAVAALLVTAVIGLTIGTILLTGANRRITAANVEIREQRNRAEEQRNRAQKNAGDAQFSVGLFYQKTSKRDDARTAFKKCVEIREELVAANPDVEEYVIGLVQTYDKLGKLTSDGETKLAHYDKAIAHLHPFVQQEAEPAVRELLAKCRDGRASALGKLKRFEAALAEWDQVVALCDGPNKLLARLDRSTALVEMKQLEAAIAAVNEVIGHPDVNGEVFVLAAAIFLGLAEEIGDEETIPEAERKSRKEEYVDRGFKLVGKSVDAGYFDDLLNESAFATLTMTILFSEPEFAPLKAHPDYAKLQKQIRDRAAIAQKAKAAE